jgi:hypothetical protein
VARVRRAEDHHHANGVLVAPARVSMTEQARQRAGAHISMAFLGSRRYLLSLLVGTRLHEACEWRKAGQARAATHRSSMSK